MAVWPHCSELEECLLVMPFDQMVEFLKLTDYWLEVRVHDYCRIDLTVIVSREVGRWSWPVGACSSCWESTISRLPILTFSSLHWSLFHTTPPHKSHISRYSTLTHAVDSTHHLINHMPQVVQYPNTRSVVTVVHTTSQITYLKCLTHAMDSLTGLVVQENVTTVYINPDRTWAPVVGGFSCCIHMLVVMLSMCTVGHVWVQPCWSGVSEEGAGE